MFKFFLKSKYSLNNLKRWLFTVFVTEYFEFLAIKLNAFRTGFHFELSLEKDLEMKPCQPETNLMKFENHGNMGPDVNKLTSSKC